MSTEIAVRQNDRDGAAPVSPQNPVSVSGQNALVTASFTRPNDSTPYTTGDLIANNTAVQSVAMLDLTIGRGTSGVSTTGMIRRARLRKTGKSLTNASFRIHFFRANILASAVATMTSANPGVVTQAAHGLATGAPVAFTTTGALPTNVVSGTVYYAIVIDADTYSLASTSANAYSGTKIDTTAGVQSGVHTSHPGLAVGDNGVLSFGGCQNYVGKIDITCDQTFTDGASGNGSPAIGSEINFTSQHYYALLEDRAGYTPIANEVFTVELECLQN